MDSGANTDTKALLDAWRAGDADARDQLFKVLYSELRQVSAALLRAERNASLSTGDLVNEAVLRLINLNKIEWADKTHFLALSARAMRRVLIDHARKKNTNKRRHEKVTLITRIAGAGPERLDLDTLDKALIRLAAIDENKAEIVELRYFGNMTLEEVAEVTGQSVSSVKRSWRVARAWLFEAMKQSEEHRNATL